MNPKNVRALFILAWLTAACTGAAVDAPPADSAIEEPIQGDSSIFVLDQEAHEGQIIIGDVHINQAGWLVIQLSEAGVPGDVIGYAAVNAGENHDLLVEIDLEKATASLFASVYLDAGILGTYEFPGDDIPLKNGDSPNQMPFNITITEDPLVEESAETEPEGYTDPNY